MDKKSLKIAIKYTVYVLILVSGLFVCATGLWIFISPYKFPQFFEVLSKILKNAGSYSVLLVGIVITTFFKYTLKKRN